VKILVSSAKGANGDGYGAVLAFDYSGSLLGAFCEDTRITDPRGMCVDPSGELLYVNAASDRILAIDYSGVVQKELRLPSGLELGGAVFGPDGNFYATSRNTGTIVGFPSNLEESGKFDLLPVGTVEFPRGFTFDDHANVVLASGVSPTGEGDETIKLFNKDAGLINPALIRDPHLSPLDLTKSPDGRIVVSSEWPFGADDAEATIRVYDQHGGELLNVLRSTGQSSVRRPRGLRLSADKRIYWVSQDLVVAFDYEAGSFVGEIVRYPRLYGQAVVLFG
jgi:WD40 repeat protein